MAVAVVRRRPAQTTTMTGHVLQLPQINAGGPYEAAFIYEEVCSVSMCREVVV